MTSVVPTDAHSQNQAASSRLRPRQPWIPWLSGHLRMVSTRVSSRTQLSGLIEQGHTVIPIVDRGTETHGYVDPCYGMNGRSARRESYMISALRCVSWHGPLVMGAAKG